MRSFQVLSGSKFSLSRHVALREKVLRDLSRGALVFLTAQEARWWRRWCWSLMAAVIRLIVRESRRMSGGAMPDRMGRNKFSVGRMQPVMMRIVSFRLTSSFFVWALRHHTGDAYSAALNTRASAPVRRVEVYAPQLEPARQRRRPFLALTLCRSESM